MKRSPAMEQFFRAKQAHPDAILFFRMGDFYEMFFEDAVLASELLELTLTSRGSDEHGAAIPMAGVPHHAASGYLARLLELGQRVAICEQMEDPSKVKGIVPREVVRVMSPGLVLDLDALDARSQNYLAALTGEGSGPFGLAVLELSTFEARACELENRTEAWAELVRLACSELLLDERASELGAELKGLLPRLSLRSLDATERAAALTEPRIAPILEQSRKDFGALAQAAVAAVLAYAQRAEPGHTLALDRIAPYDPSRQLLLDETAIRNLELVSTLSGDRGGSLLAHIDETKTAGGARLLRQRLLAPLTELSAIRRRHDAVEVLLANAPLRLKLRELLGRVTDLERSSTRALLGAASPRELGAVARSLTASAELGATLADAASAQIDSALAGILPVDRCEDLCARISAALSDELPQVATHGGFVRAGFDPRVDELRSLSDDSKSVILELEQRERTRTGIASLKVRFTKVFGYYIEISKARLDAAPSDYRRKQTVAGGERFTTEELDALQAKILNADERLRALELEIFEKLRTEVGAASPRLRKLAHALSDLDVHCALAELAHRYGYVRPEVDDSVALELIESRHPIVERAVASGTFVPNDITLDADGDRLMVITGPNMAGKSTAMRQAALCVILAQAGSFVPAARARIGLCDRIYTRVGASDNVAQGQSTFMVEMRETASMLRGATRRSLVVLDEIGRGTSTYDGLAIAWAVAEHLHDAIGCRALFATHYHELCELSVTRKGVVNFNVAAHEHEQRMVFLRKLVPGGANRSFGVEVARLAGVPEIVLARARAMLIELEAGASLPSGAPSSLRSRRGESPQLDMFVQAKPEQSELERTLQALDVDRMTPVDALVALARLKQLVKPKSS